MTLTRYMTVEALVADYKIEPKEVVKQMSLFTLYPNRQTTTVKPAISFRISFNAGGHTDRLLVADYAEPSASYDDMVESLKRIYEGVESQFRANFDDFKDIDLID